MLEKLNLYSNNIQSITELFHLLKLTALKELDLRLNPITKGELDYRLFVVHLLPSLRYLDNKPIRDRERKAALVCFTTERAFELQDLSPASGVNDSPIQPRAAYITSLGKKYSVLDDDEAVLNIIVKCESELNKPSCITGSTKKDPDAELHSLQGIRLIDDGISYRKERKSEGLNCQPINKQQEYISKIIYAEKNILEEADEVPQRLCKPPVWQPQHLNINHLPDKNGICVKFRDDKSQFNHQQDANLKLKNVVDSQYKIVPHIDFTPHPSTDAEKTIQKCHYPQNTETFKNKAINSADLPQRIRQIASKQNLCNVKGIDKTEDNKYEANTFFRKMPLIKEDESPEQFDSTAMEYLLDLVDKYWTGPKSLHTNETFLCQAKHVVFLMHHHSPNDHKKISAALEDKMHFFALENKYVHTQLSQCEEENNSKIQSIELQLNSAEMDMDVQKKQMDIVLQENDKLKHIHLKTEERNRFIPDSSDRNMHNVRALDLQSHNQHLQLEIDALKCKLQYFDKIQKLSEMLQEGHRSLISYNVHLMPELKDMHKRHKLK
ncbi:centrosomal protein of 72 kDa [Discoglossus pictus]